MTDIQLLEHAQTILSKCEGPGSNANTADALRQLVLLNENNFVVTADDNYNIRGITDYESAIVEAKQLLDEGEDGVKILIPIAEVKSRTEYTVIPLF